MPALMVSRSFEGRTPEYVRGVLLRQLQKLMPKVAERFPDHKIVFHKNALFDLTGNRMTASWPYRIE